MTRPLDRPALRAALAVTPRELDLPVRAAVALALADIEGDLSVLLVRRSEHPRDPWSGHMAFPGGHEQRSDADLVATARRETREEVGLELSGAELLGRLDDVTPLRNSNLLVRPYVFFVEELKPLTLSEEVAEAVWVPLMELSRGRVQTTTIARVGESDLSVPAFTVGNRVVWGMTFRVLSHFLNRIAQR